MAYSLDDYVDVPSRVREFYKRHPEGSLQMDPVTFHVIEGKTWAVGRAYAYRTPDDPRPGIGTAWEPVPGTTPYTRGSELQNLETSAWGRALGALGIGIGKSIASREEVKGAEHRAHALDKVPDDDTFYTSPPPTYQGQDAYSTKRITDKQKGLLKGKLEAVGVTGDQLIPTINALLTMHGEQPVTLPAELNNRTLDVVLKNLDKITTVDAYLAESG